MSFWLKRLKIKQNLKAKILGINRAFTFKTLPLGGKQLGDK